MIYYYKFLAKLLTMVSIAILMNGCLGFDLSDHDPGKLQNIAGVWSVTGYTVDGQDSIQVIHDIKADLFTFKIAKDGRGNLRKFGAEINGYDSIYSYSYYNASYYYQDKKDLSLSFTSCSTEKYDTIQKKPIKWDGNFVFPISRDSIYIWQIMDWKYKNKIIMRLDRKQTSYELVLSYHKDVLVF